jgi:hypothetical protein
MEARTSIAILSIMLSFCINCLESFMACGWDFFIFTDLDFRQAKTLSEIVLLTTRNSPLEPRNTDMNMITLQISGQQIHIDRDLNATVDLRPDGLHIRAARSAEPATNAKAATAVKVRKGKPNRVEVHLDRVKAGADPIEICRSTIITPLTLFLVVTGQGYYAGRGGSGELWNYYYSQHRDAWCQLFAAGWLSIPDDIV